MPSLKEEVYAVLRGNLVAVDPSYADKDVVLCPICRRGIRQAEVHAGGIEHIIPQVAANKDSSDYKARATLSQRCGITLLCRQERVCKSDGYVSKDGCNGLKGRFYDRLFKDFFDDGPRRREELTHQHGVRILMMGYWRHFNSSVTSSFCAAKWMRSASSLTTRMSRKRPTWIRPCTVWPRAAPYCSSQSRASRSCGAA